VTDDARERPALTLDCRGRRCPIPVITLARRIGDVAVAGVVSVLSDDPASRTDIPAWCRMRGQQFVGESPAPGGGAAFLVRRLS